jgi:SAM-dependent methyltransferase
MEIKRTSKSSIKTGRITRCQTCHSKKLHLILDLGHQPLCDTLLTEKMLHEPEITYPLRMLWCEECTCVQLDYCVDGKVVFHKDYPYRSGISKPLAEYQKNIARSLKAKYGLTKKDLVVDVGSNDGTMLKGFKALSIRSLGVEPTNIAKLANKDGVKTIQALFDRKTAASIKKNYGQARVITTTNVFAHVQDLDEVIQSTHDLLTDDGVFISETHYLLDVIEGGQFDTIYHEHLRTYSLRSLIALFKKYDFTVTDVERGDRYGGNIRVHVTKGKGRPVSKAVEDLLKLEQKRGLHKLKTYRDFAKRSQTSRDDFRRFLLKVKASGRSIAGKSCPGRAVTLLNY